MNIQTNLETYIRKEQIKELFGSCEIISDIKEAEKTAYDIYFGKRCNLIFDTSFLKNRFFTVIKEYENNICIINCDSKQERFENDVNEACGLIIFDHVNKCHDINILKKINNKILVC